MKVDVDTLVRDELHDVAYNDCRAVRCIGYDELLNELK